MISVIFIMTLEQLINEAARSLPLDCQIRITIEAGAGWVDLVTPDGKVIDFMEDGDIKEAFLLAMDCSKSYKEGKK